MQVYDAIAGRMKALGVSAVFSVPASETMKINVSAVRHGLQHFAARHEQAAIGMADGYFRSTRKPGVVLLGRGPSLTNGANAMITAAKGHSGILVLAGALPTSLGGDPEAVRRHILSAKAIDQWAFLTSLGMVVFEATSADSAVSDVEACYRLAESGVAVALVLPTDIITAEAGDAPAAVDIAPRTAAEHDGTASPDDIETAAEVLGEDWAARRPLILAGRGAVLADAGEELAALADRTGGLLATSLAARGLFDGHPYDLGIVGTMATAVGAEMVSRSTIVLAFGASLNPFTTLGGDLLRDARIVQVDTDASALGLRAPVDLEIAGDAKAVARQLLGELDRRGHTARSSVRSPEIAERIAAEREWSVESPRHEPGKLDPREALIALDRVLPEDRAVVADGGSVLAYTGHYLRPEGPRSFVFNLDYGSVGGGFGIALGLAAARNDRPTVIGTGDGGYMFSAINDLDTAVRYGLRLVVIVLNDGGFGQEAYLLEMDNLESGVADYPNPSFVGVSRALGAEAILLSSLDDVNQVGDLVKNARGPVVVEVPISRVLPQATELVMRLGHRQR